LLAIQRLDQNPVNYFLDSLQAVEKIAAKRLPFPSVSWLSSVRLPVADKCGNLFKRLFIIQKRKINSGQARSEVW